MPTIDIGVDFSDVQDMDKFPVIPNGTYPVTARNIDAKPSSKGRPMLTWWFDAIDEATGDKASIPYNTVLPWEKDGEIDVSGCGMLVQVCKALGLPWTGKKLNTEDYIGRSGMAEIIQQRKQTKDPDTGAYVDDPSGDKVNAIKKFIY